MVVGARNHLPANCRPLDFRFEIRAQDRGELRERLGGPPHEAMPGFPLHLSTLVHNEVKALPKDHETSHSLQLEIAQRCPGRNSPNTGKDGIGRCMELMKLMLEFMQARPAVASDLARPERVEQTSSDPDRSADAGVYIIRHLDQLPVQHPDALRL